MKQIPNIFTLLNLVFGCFAIVCILQNGITIQYSADGSQLIDIPEKIWLGSLFIAIAAVIDFLDGFVATTTAISPGKTGPIRILPQAQIPGRPPASKL